MFDREKAYKRYNRIERHRRIWSIVRFMLVINSLNKEMNSFYEYQNRIKEYKDITSYINTNKDRPTIQDIHTAIRLCKMKYKNGKCDYSINDSDINIIYNWELYQIDHKTILKKIFPLFKEYWDNVLLEYKRIGAKKNRLKYLVELLQNMDNKDFIISNDLHGDILDLINHYKHILQETLKSYPTI